MKINGDNDVVAIRRALLDALDALQAHRDSIVLIGAQAIYLHTGAVAVALAETTKDSDLALDARSLANMPLLEEAMRASGFVLDTTARQPGTWISSAGIPVDLMVPETLAGTAGRRGARIPPHSKHAARRADGLEAAVVDHQPMAISALDPTDDRRLTANVAGPAALLVAKLHKLGERQNAPDRLVDKDAHDVYRLFVAVPTETLAATLTTLRHSELAGVATETALAYLQQLFALGPQATGSMMAGRAEEGVGEPETVSASVALLADDVLTAVNAR